MADFAGFSTDGLALLGAIGAGDKAHFDAHRERYVALVLEPAKAFVAAMTGRLRSDISPGLEGQPKTNGSIAPINNDLRFSPDKAPYKDHLLFKWWQGPEKKTAPTLYVRLSPTEVGFAVGRVFTPPVLDAWREAVSDEGTGALLASAIETLGANRDIDIAGSALKRVPKPFAPHHPRGALLRHKMLQVRFSESVPSSVDTASFVDFCIERLAETEPVLFWLTDELP